MRIVQVDDHQVLDYLLFPNQNPQNYEYINRNLQSFSTHLNEAGMQFMMAHTTAWSAIDENDIARRARQALRVVQNIHQPDIIMPLLRVEQIQSANLVMQRYVMAQPDLRNLYHRNRADGYRDTYQDMEPGLVGRDHNDWRRAATGDVLDTPEGIVIRHYSTDDWVEEPVLASDQRLAIRRTWEAVKDAIDRGIDPSNPFGGEIGI